MLAVPMKRKPFETAITVRTLLIAALIVGLAAAVVSILDALLLVFLGIFLALVFEIPVRAFMRKTGRGRGLSATIVVLGTAVAATMLALLLLVPLVGSLRDFLQDLPELVDELRDSDELSWIGDSGCRRERPGGGERPRRVDARCDQRDPRRRGRGLLRRARGRSR